MQSRVATLEFMDHCRSAQAVSDIALLLFDQMEACGIRFVACASHVDPKRPPAGAVMLLNYPKPWVDHYSQNDLAKRDPVFWGAHNVPRPFWWRDFARAHPIASDQKRILNEAAECGIRNGFTIPIHSPGALPASCSLIPGPDGIDPLDVPDLQAMALHAHEEARLRAGDAPRPLVALTKRQRECLALVMRGKSDAVIGEILGISTATVRHTVEHTRARFGVSSRVQAAVLAITQGTLTLSDMSD